MKTVLSAILIVGVLASVSSFASDGNGEIGSGFNDDGVTIKKSLFDACVVEKTTVDREFEPTWCTFASAFTGDNCGYIYKMMKYTKVVGFNFVRSQTTGRMEKASETLYSTPETRSSYNERQAKEYLKQLKIQAVCP